MQEFVETIYMKYDGDRRLSQADFDALRRSARQSEREVQLYVIIYQILKQDSCDTWLICIF